MGRKVAGHPANSPSAMVRTKTTRVHKREASDAKEASLQHALAAYQEALMSDAVLSIREVARRFNVSKTTLQPHINGRSCILESNPHKSRLPPPALERLVTQLIRSTHH